MMNELDLEEVIAKADNGKVKINMEEGILLCRFFEFHVFRLELGWGIIYPFSMKIPLTAGNKDDLFNKLLDAALELKMIRKEILTDGEIISCDPSSSSGIIL